MSSSRINYRRENSVDSNQNADDDGYDMVTGVNLIPQMVPEFLTGWPLQYRNKPPYQQCTNDDTLDTTRPAQHIPVPAKNWDASRPH